MILAGLLYFIPEFEGAAVARAAELGARYGSTIVPVLGTASLECRKSVGPGNAYGLLLSPLPSNRDGQQAETTFDAESQRWHWVGVGPSRYAVGVSTEPEKRPTPEDLERANICEGREVELGDGQRWLVPVVGPLNSTLPHGFRRAADGNFEPTIRAQYSKLFERSQWWFDLCRNGGAHTWAQFFGFACEVLAINYRLGPDEISTDVLDLVGIEHRDPLLRACVGLMDRDDERARKKKPKRPASPAPDRPAGSDSTPGGPA